MARTIAELAVQVGVDGVDGVKRALGSVGDSVDGVAGKFSGAFGQAAGNLISGFVTSAGSSLMGLAGSLIGSNAQLETLSNSFSIAVGDADEASRMFGNLQKFAASTPFEFPELIQAATNLEALGIDSEKYLTTLGNAAAGTGKTLDQATQAFMDASVGEFERLKEFGIQTRREGDNVVFSYMENGKMVTKTVDATNQEVIQSTLAGIWNDRYAGAMDTQSKSFAGLMSTLKDNINMTMAAIGKPIFDFAKRGLQAMVSFFGVFDRMRKNGLSPFQAAVVALKLSLMKLFGSQYSQAIRKTIDSIADALITAKNVAGTALGFISDLFGKAFGWLAANGSLVMAALKGIGIALIALGAGAAILAIAGGALALLTSPIFLIAAAAAGLGIAWKTNFLGIRDITAKAVSAIMPYVDRFRAWLGGLIAMAPRLLPPIKAAFAGILGAIQPLIPIVGMVMGVLGNLVGYLIDVARGGDVLTSAFSSLPGPIATVFQLIGNYVAVFRDVVVGLFDIIKNLINGDFSGAWEALKTMIGNVVSGVITQLSLLGQLFEQVLSGLWAGIQAAWPVISGWLSSLATEIPGYLADALNWLVQAGTDLLTGLNNAIVAYWPTVSAWFTALAAEVPGYLSTALTWLTQAGTDLITGLQNAIAAYWPTVSAWFTALAAEIPGYLSTALTWLTQAGTDLLTGLYNAIVAYWPTVSSWFLTLVTLVPSLLIDVLTWLAPFGKDLITGAYNAITENWKMISDWFITLVTLVPSLLIDVIMWLVPFGKDLITGAYNAITENWKTISDWFLTLVTLVPSLLIDVITWLAPAGKDLITGMYDAITGFWDDTLKPWFSAIGSAIYDVLSYLVLPLVLVEHGSAIMQGFKDGVDTVWKTVTGFFGGIATAVTDAIGSLLYTLWQTGWDIIQGMQNGVSSKWDDFTGWLWGKLRELPGVVKDFFGIQSPSRLMRGLGQHIGDGLALGIADSMVGVTAAADSLAAAAQPNLRPISFGAAGTAAGGLSGVAGRFLAGASAAGSTTTSTTTQTFNISLNLADLKELVAAAEFVQALPRERQLVLAGGV